MMDWSDYCSILVMRVIELLCYIFLFRFFAAKRNGKTGFKTAVYFVVSVLLLWANTITFFEWLFVRVVISLVITAFVMYRMFQVGYIKALVLCMLCNGASLIADCTATAVLGAFYPLFELREVHLGDYLIVHTTIILCKVGFWGILLCLSKMFRNKIADVLAIREWCVLFIVSLITIFFIVAIAQEINQMYKIEQPLYLLSIIAGIFFINFIVYYLIGSIMNRELKLREHAIFREKVKNETAMYHSISENLGEQRKRTHEYKNQLAAISALAKEGAYQELNAYIEKIEVMMLQGLDAVDTNNVIVNAILNTKYREAVSKGIVFVLKVNDLSELKIEEEDIVVILSNLLNNALEACEQCEDKVIKVKFVLENGHTVISVKNSMRTEPIVENGTYLTSKTKDAENHGMGIQNVVETIEKYSGRYMVDYGKENFLFSILIPNN